MGGNLERKSVICARVKHIFFLTDCTDYTDLCCRMQLVTLHQEPPKAQIRGICDICERIKTYLVILAHGLHGSHRFFTLPNATPRKARTCEG